MAKKYYPRLAIVAKEKFGLAFNFANLWLTINVGIILNDANFVYGFIKLQI